MSITRANRFATEVPQRLPQRLLMAAVAFYVLAVLLTSAIPSLSKLVHVSILLTLVAILFKCLTERISLRAEPLLVAVWVFFAFAAASIFWASNQSGAVVSLASLFTDVLGASVVWIALWNGVTIRFVAYVATAAASVQAALAVKQFLLAGGGASRVVGLVDNPNTLAIQLALTGFLLLLAAHKSKVTKVVVVALFVTATIVSGSRKMVFAWLALALLLFRDLGLRLRTSPIGLGLFLILVPVLILGAVSYREVLFEPLTGLNTYQRVLYALEGSDSSTRIRLTMVREAGQLWMESPLVGHGIDQFRYISDFGTYSHNNYTEILVSFGLVGFVLYYYVVFTILARSGGAALKNRAGAIHVLVGCLLLLLWDFALVSYASRMVWLFLAVLGYASSLEGSIEIAGARPKVAKVSSAVTTSLLS